MRRSVFTYLLIVTLFLITLSGCNDDSTAPAEDGGDSVTAEDVQMPSTPQNMIAEAVSSSQIDLGWDAATDDRAVAGYTIYRNGTALVNLGTLTYTDTGLAADTAYTYEVTAYDAAGNESEKSDSVTVTTHTDSDAGGDESSTDDGDPGYSDPSDWIGPQAPTFAELCPQGDTAPVHIVSPGDSLQAVIDDAASGDVIKVGAGTYEESILISNKSLCICGGFSATDDFAISDPTENPTVLIGTQDQAVVSINTAGATVVAGFTLQNGRHGVAIDGAVGQGVTIASNIIENNGVASESRGERGGGLYIKGYEHRIINNIIRKNVSGIGAGVYSTGEDILIEGNLIEENEAYSDHGGATYLVGSVRLAYNVVQHNLVSAALDWGSGAGVFINGPNTVGYVAFNVVRFNHANAYGGGVDSDGGATIYMNNTLVYGNTSNGRAPGVYISEGDPQPGTLVMTHCTVFGNTADDPNCGFGLDARGGTAQVSNSIFWGDEGNTFFVNPSYEGSSIIMEYSIAEQEWPGNGNTTVDPLFAGSENNDFHLQSKAGRWDPAANSGEGGWTTDTQHSPGIDAGDPTKDYAMEPHPNGSRTNIGAYGATSEASKSLSQ